MKRWHLSVIVGLLAAVGIALAATPVVGAVVGGTAWALLADAGPEPVVAPAPVEAPPKPIAVDPMPTRPIGGSLIPELDDPGDPPVTVLPPDPPEPEVHYGCGGHAVPIDQPVPACGMG